jgi:GGDEF domain-containing protein
VTLVYADLNEFKAYVDYYGFERASLAIQRSAQLFHRVLLENSDPEDFVGHIGGDDFVFVVAPSRAEQLCEQVLESFEQLAPTLYNEADRERGYVEGQDRYGVQRRFAVMTLSLSIIDIAEESLVDMRDVGTFASLCKREVKNIGGNAFARFQFEPMGD